ncbi:putative glycerol-1-phosphate prenyltransferase [Breznakibacter xylanolyticus]|uniref:Geranylgeranylglyceryl phosphate synthase n=1 Tax=Breznakibacter xylanolyticus TaxID=990 RepID=A0A2W7Q5C1_9BACT|nr:geranylgeranylglyceryl/heptaprenylglyceryl phosphate synthase [Breznakibacter xylanolyticus]PZX16909.1 putative glycerol-1-phosphate prenyltransferase [Breznakibacter xylanolyticus]
MNIYASILTKSQQGKKQLAVLIDPDKCDGDQLQKTITLLGETKPDMVLVGGSLVSTLTDSVVEALKQNLDLPVVLYPGSLLQLSHSADAILFISLISGRNPEFLIGNHVVAAPILHRTPIEVISTGYMIIDGGKPTSVEYMSNTMPIPASKTDIAVATALAGQYLGMKMIYMDGGSGAHQPVPVEMITAVKQILHIPLMIGGGLNTPEKVEAACNAGADLIVVGNALEKDPALMRTFTSIVQQSH